MLQWFTRNMRRAGPARAGPDRDASGVPVGKKAGGQIAPLLFQYHGRPIPEFVRDIEGALLADTGEARKEALGLAHDITRHGIHAPPQAWAVIVTDENGEWRRSRWRRHAPARTRPRSIWATASPGSSRAWSRALAAAPWSG